jgi:3'(2'),5'-bisphosphate nucleotidase
MPAEILDTARTLAVEAGRRVIDLLQSPLIKERKADHSLVTNADRAADEIILAGLRANFPHHSILTEESGVQGRMDAEFVWVVDPLDGTRAYAKGIPGYSVMIGLLRNGEPFAGVVVDPLENRIYEALRGEGAYHTYQGKREKMRVSKRNEWSEMPIITSTGFPGAFETVLKTKLPCPWIPAVNSVGIKIGLLARQQVDLYVNHHHVHYWDTVAPQIILEEAGGVFTFFDGRPLTYDLKSDFRHTEPTVATNGRRHSEFVRIIQELA